MNSNKKLAVLLLVVFFLISGAYGESVSVGRGSSVAVNEGSSAEGILTSDGSITQSSVSSVGFIDDLNIDPWVQNTNGDYAEIGVTGTNVAGFTYSDNYYPVKDQVGVSDAVWAQQWIGASSADSLHAYARASNSAGDNAGSNLDISYGSLKGYYNAAYAGPASWLGIDRGAFVQQTLDRAEASKIVAKTWAVDPAGDAAGALTDVRNGDLTGYSVLAASAGYSNGLKAVGVSVDSMSASSPSGSIYQVMNTYNSKGDTSTVSLDKATTVTGYDGKAYAYDATASATETGHVTGPFVGTANVGTATTTRTPNFGSEYDLSMTATTGSAPTGTLGYYVDPSMSTSTLGAIQGAVNAAQSGDTINAAAGTYKENVVLDKSLTVNGAGSRTTTVDGDQKGSVFTIPSGVTVTLADMTIQGGEVQSPAGGGGIYNAGTLTVKDCKITGNTANGGGIYNTGTATITDSNISGNIANNPYGAANGAGIYNNGTVEVKNCILSENIGGTGERFDDGSGAGIYNNGTATVTDSTISGNVALSGDGGGIFNDGTLTVLGSTISGNSAEVTGYYGFLRSGNGGGIFNDGTLTVLGSTISGNQAGNLGGGIYWRNWRPVIDPTTVITGNSEPQIYPY